MRPGELLLGHPKTAVSSGLASMDPAIIPVRLINLLTYFTSERHRQAGAALCSRATTSSGNISTTT